jgi:hypothetical protein
MRPSALDRPGPVCAAPLSPEAGIVIRRCQPPCAALSRALRSGGAARAATIWKSISNV